MKKTWKTIAAGIIGIIFSGAAVISLIPSWTSALSSTSGVNGATITYISFFSLLAIFCAAAALSTILRRYWYFSLFATALSLPLASISGSRILDTFFWKGTMLIEYQSPLTVLAVALACIPQIINIVLIIISRKEFGIIQTVKNTTWKTIAAGIIGLAITILNIPILPSTLPPLLQFLYIPALPRLSIYVHILLVLLGLASYTCVIQRIHWRFSLIGSIITLLLAFYLGYRIYVFMTDWVYLFENDYPLVNIYLHAMIIGLNIVSIIFIATSKSEFGRLEHVSTVQPAESEQ